MQQEVYKNRIASQAVFSRKNELKSASYIFIGISYEDLRKKHQKLTLLAYDLYVTLLNEYFKNSHNQFGLTIQQVMYKTAINAQNTYHKAKNELIKLHLLKVFAPAKRGQSAQFKPTPVGGLPLMIPHSIYFWLNNLLRDKIITRPMKITYIFLYNKSRAAEHPEVLKLNNAQICKSLHLSPRPYRRVIDMLQKNSMISASKITDRHTCRDFTLFIPPDISLITRNEAPQPVVSRDEGEKNLAAIIERLKSSSTK